MNEIIGHKNNNSFGNYEVVGYINARTVYVQWDDGTVSRHKLESIRNNTISNKNFKTKYNVGYISYGKYKSAHMGNKPYHAWEKMLNRCYDTSYRSYHRYGGRGVVVCDEWHSFQIFCKWYCDNYKEGFEIDKDLLKPNSKLYSPETCTMIPHEINSLLLFSEARTGRWPIGVHYHKAAKKFRAACQTGGRVPLVVGMFDNPLDAFYAYKDFKEKRVKEIAKKYFDSGLIGDTVYSNLLNFKVVDERVDNGEF